MKRLITFAFLACAMVGAASAQQLKVGVINSQKALLDTEEIKKAQKDLEAKFKPRQDAMAKINKDLEDIQTQLQSGKLNQAGEQELQTEGQRKQKELERLQQDLQEDADAARNDVLTQAGTRMQEVVKKVAEEKGLDLVLDSASTHFFKTALEITDEAVAAYNKAYPVK